MGMAITVKVAGMMVLYARMIVIVSEMIHQQRRVRRI
jgi:hypothetical protein